MLDYTPFTRLELGFPQQPDPGEMRCVNVTIIDDGRIEETELFYVAISLSDFTGGLMRTPRIDIMDDDSGFN